MPDRTRVIGSDDSAASAANTTLTAATNQLFKVVDGGYPQRTGTTSNGGPRSAPAKPTGRGNEWAVDNGTNSGPGQLLNHKGVALGTKLAGSTWTMTAAIAHS